MAAHTSSPPTSATWTASAPAPLSRRTAEHKGLAGVARGVLSEALHETASLYSDFWHALANHDSHKASVACCSQRHCSESLVWTNALIAVPATAYLWHGYLFAGIALCLSGAASYVYHVNTEAVHWHLVVDRLGAIVGFFTTVPQVVPLMTLGSLVVSAALVFLAFWCKHNQDKSYALYHSLWHACIAVGQIHLVLHLGG